LQQFAVNFNIIYIANLDSQKTSTHNLLQYAFSSIQCCRSFKKEQVYCEGLATDS